MKSQKVFHTSSPSLVAALTKDGFFFTPSRGMSNVVAKVEARLSGNVEFSMGVRAVPFNARGKALYYLPRAEV